MCHHTRVFWRCRARLAFGVWWLRHSMELSPYLEFLSFNTTTISHNPNSCTRPPHTNLSIPNEELFHTCQHVRQTHGHRARRRAPEPVRRRSHLCRASREGSWSTRRYDFLFLPVNVQLLTNGFRRSLNRHLSQQEDIRPRRAQHPRHYPRRQDSIRTKYPRRRYGWQDNKFNGPSERGRCVNSKQVLYFSMVG